MTQMTWSKVIISEYIAAKDCKQGSVLAEKGCDENLKFPKVCLVSVYSVFVELNNVL